MQTTMLFDDGATVYTNDFSIGIGLTNDAESFGIKVGLCIGGHQYGTIDDQIVGIGGRQPLTILIDGMGKWQSQQSIGLTIDSPEFLQFLFHQRQIRMVGITTCIKNGVIRTDAYQRVDVAVGIVAKQTAVIQPYDAFGT